MKEICIKKELQRTNPDYLVYVPAKAAGGNDCGNEHFLVFNITETFLATVWTQSTFEGRPDQRIVFSRSRNGGITWEAPKTIAGGNADPTTGKDLCSWGFPLISKSGRIYVIYNKHIGLNDIFSHTTGIMACKYSDDNGDSWSEETIIDIPKDKWDNPDKKMPSNWIVWQKPLRMSDGRYLAGYTHWVSPKVRPPAPLKVWWAEEAVVQFMRFENIDDNPAPSDIKISWLTLDDKALRAGIPNYPDVSALQEPSLVELPDGRIFCVMRTATGSPYYSVSADKGATWTTPDVLRYKDEGPALIHPFSPCPIYSTGDGKYAVFFHNHNGNFGKWNSYQTTSHRRPIYFAKGEFKKDAKQPVWFSGPAFLMDNEGVPLGGMDKHGRTDLAMYASMTIQYGEPVLWYPERKFFLLGKAIKRQRLDDLDVDAEY